MPRSTQHQSRLERENERLKAMVGELTMELRGIDLLKIEGRPIKGRPWQYNFYLDLQSPVSRSELQGALDERSEQAEELRYLGQYFSISILDSK